MIIEIKGVQFVNKGAELMLCAIIQKLNNFWPEAELVLAPNKNSTYQNRIRFGAWQKLSLRKYPLDLNGLAKHLPKALRNKLKAWGIVTEADIDIVLDASGFAYGDQWNSVILEHALDEAKRMHEAGKKYIFLPQAFGPFTSSKNQSLIRDKMEYASLVCAREQQSFEHLENLMPNTSNLKMFPDFTNALVGELPDYYNTDEFEVCLIPNHNMINEKNPNKAWRSSYISLFKYVAEQCQSKGLSVYILNHEGKEDLEICNQINAQLTVPLPVITELDPIKVKGLIGGAKMILCSRFHGCVSALSQSIPCLGTSWSHKYEQLFAEYGVESSLISADYQESYIDEQLERCLASDNEIVAVLNEKSLHYKKITEAMWNEVKTVIGNYAK